MYKRIIGAAVISFLLSTTAHALPISMRTKISCLPDYYRFCDGWPTNELKRCFQINVLKVHHTCVSALVDEGLISKTEVKQMVRQALGQTKIKTASLSPTSRRR